MLRKVGVVWTLVALVCLSFTTNSAATTKYAGFIQLHPGTSYQGQLQENEVLRFYFVLERSMQVVLESHTPRDRTNNVYPEAVLFHDNGRVIARNWSGGVGRNFKIIRQLAAGTYVLRVEDARGCGSLHGCPEILRDFSITFGVTEVSPF